MHRRRPSIDRTARAEHLKERVYLTFTTLAVVVAVYAHHETDPGVAFRTVLVSAIGTLLAVFAADVIAHMVIHEALMTASELRHAAQTSFGALSAVLLPLLFLAAAKWGWWQTDTALVASAISLLLALVLIGFLAIRRLRVTWWQRLLALGMEAVIGLVVIGLQVLAKS